MRVFGAEKILFLSICVLLFLTKLPIAAFVVCHKREVCKVARNGEILVLRPTWVRSSTSACSECSTVSESGTAPEYDSDGNLVGAGDWFVDDSSSGEELGL